jgi:hypothetical protein
LQAGSSYILRVSPGPGLTAILDVAPTVLIERRAPIR